jgi:hypothetical protein
MTLTVAPERFYDHEVIGKVLICVSCLGRLGPRPVETRAVPGKVLLNRSKKGNRNKPQGDKIKMDHRSSWLRALQSLSL